MMWYCCVFIFLIKERIKISIKVNKNDFPYPPLARLKAVRPYIFTKALAHYVWLADGGVNVGVGYE